MRNNHQGTIRFHERIAMRLSLAIVLVVLITSGAVASLVLRDERTLMEMNLEIQGNQLGGIIAHQVLEPLLYEEFFDLHQLLQNYLRAPDGLLLFAQIYDSDGKLLVSEVQGPPLPGLEISIPFIGEPVYLKPIKDGADVLYGDLLVPVRGDKIGIVGYLRLGISLASMRQTLVVSGHKVRVATTFIIIFGILAGLWMARTLILPVLRISRVVQKVGDGDLDVQLPRMGVGEIRVLGANVNTMIGQLKQLIERITAAQDNLIRTEKLYALGEFSTGLAHEIKNPLTSIKMLIQRAGEQAEAIDQRDLDVILDEIDRIDSIVSRFLRSARQGEIQLQELDLNELVGEVLTITRPKIQNSGSVLFVELAETPLPVQGDPSGLKQVLLNGILNGIQAMPGGGEMVISTGHEDGKNFCAIRDNGIGISKENLKRIFDPFFTTKEEGTGMGLAVAWNIAQQHGGRLEIDSRPDQGTTLKLVLPNG